MFRIARRYASEVPSGRRKALDVAESLKSRGWVPASLLEATQVASVHARDGTSAAALLCAAVEHGADDTVRNLALKRTEGTLQALAYSEDLEGLERVTETLFRAQSPVEMSMGTARLVFDVCARFGNVSVPLALCALCRGGVRPSNYFGVGVESMARYGGDEQSRFFAWELARLDLLDVLSARSVLMAGARLGLPRTVLVVARAEMERGFGLGSGAAWTKAGARADRGRDVFLRLLGDVGAPREERPWLEEDAVMESEVGRETTTAAAGWTRRSKQRSEKGVLSFAGNETETELAVLGLTHLHWAREGQMEGLVLEEAQERLRGVSLEAVAQDVDEMEMWLRAVLEGGESSESPMVQRMLGKKAGGVAGPFLEQVSPCETVERIPKLVQAPLLRGAMVVLEAACWASPTVRVVGEREGSLEGVLQARGRQFDLWGEGLSGWPGAMIRNSDMAVAQIRSVGEEAMCVTDVGRWVIRPEVARQTLKASLKVAGPDGTRAAAWIARRTAALATVDAALRPRLAQPAVPGGLLEWTLRRAAALNGTEGFQCATSVAEAVLRSGNGPHGVHARRYAAEKMRRHRKEWGLELASALRLQDNPNLRRIGRAMRQHTPGTPELPTSFASNHISILTRAALQANIDPTPLLHIDAPPECFHTLLPTTSDPTSLLRLLLIAAPKSQQSLDVFTVNILAKHHPPSTPHEAAQSALQALDIVRNAAPAVQRAVNAPRDVLFELGAQISECLPPDAPIVSLSHFPLHKIEHLRHCIHNERNALIGKRIAHASLKLIQSLPAYSSLLPTATEIFHTYSTNASTTTSDRIHALQSLPPSTLSPTLLHALDLPTTPPSAWHQNAPRATHWIDLFTRSATDALRIDQPLLAFSILALAFAADLVPDGPFLRLAFTRIFPAWPKQGTTALQLHCT